MARHRHVSWFTREHQFSLAHEALEEARNHLRSHWYASSISHSWQVVHRAAAGLVLGLGAKIFTEKEVRYGFSAQFVASGRLPASTLADYDRVDAMRLRAELDPDYTATRQEAQDALELAEGFWKQAQALVA